MGTKDYSDKASRPRSSTTNNSNLLSQARNRIGLATLLALSFVLITSLPRAERVLRQQQKREMGMDETLFEVVSKAVMGVQPDEFMLKEEDALNGEDEAEEASSSSLQIAWLMSFPNSGTSYTIKTIRHIAMTGTASNYGHENKADSGDSIPVFADQPSGPYWTDPKVHPEYDLPTDYVLTKTHCGTRCIQCGPMKYVETTFSFRKRCLSGRRMTVRDGVQVGEEVAYPSTRVKKTIHIIRNPFDNVVSRFHLELHDGKSGQTFPRTRDGFREFCREMNDAHPGQENQVHFLDPEILDILKNVPCRADFIRYIEWHNLAFATSRDLGLDTYVLHYDWYATRFNQTIDELLHFLHLEARADPEPFVLGKVYADHFTAEERRAVHTAFLSLASTTSWHHIGRYFTM